MKSITIHGLDPNLWAILTARAKTEGRSLNQTIKNLLEVALGVKHVPDQPHRQDFEEFCGMWSEEETRQFTAAIADLEAVDTSDWR